MYVKKIKRKCNVRGCKNTETYAISKSREMGNSIIACKDCLMDALAEIELKYAPVEAPVEVEQPVEETKVEEAPPVEAPVEVKRQRKK